jgi:6-pyruvoyltetrahydropterin/6-carboxytetrahydropterin synthase
LVTLTRTYEFAAAHRLHSDALTLVENRELFGKCNNPHGHGHNYLLEVTVGGEPDPTTGFLIDLPLLDRTVNREIVDRYDHRHLNLDLEEFQALNPTSENLVKVVWQRLAKSLPAGALRRVAIHETERNLFVYEGPDQGVSE